MKTEIAHINSVFAKKLNVMRKKLHNEAYRYRLLKHESRQLHHLCDKMIADGRLTLSELQENVDNKSVSKIKLNTNGL